MIDIIAIDGPASSGKGTIARIIAEKLNFHYLESGAIYRALGLLANELYPKREAAPAEIIALVDEINLEFIDERIMLNGVDVTTKLRQDFIGMLASKYGSINEVRTKLLNLQRSFAQTPGLITDGRDMGSVVFPEARLKVFLTASATIRATRRYKQLHQIDKSVTIESILRDILTRDTLDTGRSAAPLEFSSAYKLLDNSHLTIDETVSQILTWYHSLV